MAVYVVLLVVILVIAVTLLAVLFWALGSRDRPLGRR
jgi:type II secretory pathway pseudopilin PulG